MMPALLPVIDTLKTAWDKTYGAKRAMWGILGIIIVISIILYLINGQIYGFHTKYENPFIFLLKLLTQIIGGVCLTYLGILKARDIPIRMNMAMDVINEGTVILKVFALIALYALFFLCLFVAMTAGTVLFYSLFTVSKEYLFVVTSIWYALMILIILYVMLGAFLSYGYVIDQKRWAITAIKLSFLSTKGNLLRILAIVFLLILIILISAIPLGIGLIWTLPFSRVCYGLIYNRLAVPEQKLS